jgi:translation initiation factor 2B subunit (eIF-2B alpha/beta/delta family)
MGVIMKQEDRQNLYKLFRDHGDTLGADGTARVALESFIRSIQDLRCPPEKLEQLVAELIHSIKHTEPQITPLVHLIEEVENEMAGQFSTDLKATKGKITSLLNAKIDRLKDIGVQMTARGLKCIDRYDVIIVYSTSTSIRDTLVKANKIGKPFEVLILKQDFTKTRKLIWTASGEKIDHEVIPEYNLSNFITKANKFFLGSISITPDNKAVCPLGSAEVVSLCHLNKIPIYLFANSLKFSHKASSTHKIHEKRESRRDGQTSYAMTIHSHCLVDLEHVDFIVREDGVIPREEFCTRFLC